MTLDRDAFLHQLESASPEEFARLLRDADPSLLAGYFGDNAAHLRSLAQPTRGAQNNLGNVVILHGVLGSHLAEGGSTIWLNPWNLLRGRFTRLAPGAARITPRGLLKRYYGKQVLTLAQRWHVQAFAYDWRLPLGDSAAALARAIDNWFPADAPVHLVAHSMGGLVARTYLAQRPQHTGRLVLLGTPNLGSYAIPQLLHGMHSLLTPLALLDLEHSRAEILETIRSWPGVHAMDPANPSLAGLPIDPARMVYVAGSGRNTAVAIADAARPGERKGYHWSPAGDGTVPHCLGLLPSVPTYYADEEHGALPSNATVLAAVDEILETGATTLLAQSAILHRGDAAEPSREFGGFLGVAKIAKQTQPAHPTVRCADLAEAKPGGAILIGHYEGVEPLLAAQYPALRALDSVLPTRLGEPFVIPGAPPLLVIGLGPVGRLGEAELVYFAERTQWAANQFGFCSLATTLIGSGAGNLPLERAAAIWRTALSVPTTFYERDPSRAARLTAALERPALQTLGEAPEEIRPNEAISRLSVERTPAGYRIALLTNEATIPEREIPLDHALIEEINAELGAGPEADQWASCLRLLLLPHELRAAAQRIGPVVVACDRDAAQLRWEHLHPAVSRQFRSVRAPFCIPRRALRRVLIVADSCADAPLPAAAAEGRALTYDLRQRGLDVVSLLGPAAATRARVLRELLLHPYDAVHFAGHCTYNCADPSASGWVFSANTVLSARELARLDRAPQFVFSNACESGIVPPAAAVPSFAEVLLGLGVEHLIATGRPVGDQAAEAFARAFWQAANEPMHRALAKARRAAGSEAPSWQHYGDPAAVLVVAA